MPRPKAVLVVGEDLNTSETYTLLRKPTRYRQKWVIFVSHVTVKIKMGKCVPESPLKLEILVKPWFYYLIVT